MKPRRESRARLDGGRDWSGPFKVNDWPIGHDQQREEKMFGIVGDGMRRVVVDADGYGVVGCAKSNKTGGRFHPRRRCRQSHY